MLSCLGLGTVQFGMHYGVSNSRGQPDETEVAAILDGVRDSGIGYLDTAFAYPNSESLIGRYLSPGSNLKIVTKTAPIKDDEIGRGHKPKILEEVARSLDRLRVDRVYGLLVHHAGDLDKPGWEYLVEALNEAKTRGWVGRTGASVYGESQLELVERRFRPDLIQGPFNVLDRRLVSSDCFVRLKANGVEMHARSVFLQGLLLMQSSALPAFFEPVKPAIASLQASWAEQGRSALAACLGFVMGHPAIDVAIVGVDSLSQLEEIRAAALLSPERTARMDFAPPIDQKYLDPSHWPSFAP